MKQTILLLTGLFLTITAFSQDLIVKNNGKKIECHIIREDSLNIYFSFWQNDLSEVKSFINKNDTREVIYNVKGKKDAKRDSLTQSNDNRRKSLTIGVLEGGGSIVGMDVEIPFNNTVSLQFGAGFIGFGAGIDIHFRPTVRSSFFTIQYWHQGVGSFHTQSLIGPAFVFRARKLFTAQIGLGYAIDRGPALPENYNQPQVMLTYAIGVYFPFL